MSARRLVLTTLFAFAAWRAAAGEAPDDLAEKMVSALRAALPGAEVKIQSPDTIKLKLGNSPEFTVGLDSVRRSCLGDPDGCPAKIREFARKTAVTALTADLPHERKQLRAVVRDKSYLDNLNALHRQAGRNVTIVSTPIVGDLVEMCYFDLDVGLSPATDEDVAKLGLDPAAALALCVKNVHDALPPLASAAEMDDSGTGLLSGDVYASSYLLFHDDWAAIAARLHGRLLVIVPEADIVAFVEEHDPGTAHRLSLVAADNMRTAARPISATVLRWTPQGWEVAD